MGTAISLFADENFAALFQLFFRRVITWKQFLKLPQPQGISPLEAWNTLGSLGRLVGINTSLPTEHGSQYWYLPTFELMELVSRLSLTCADTSPLSSTLFGRDNAHGLMELRLIEIRATLEMEGLELADGRLRDLVTEQAEPTCTLEQLALNLYRLDEELGTFADAPFSHKLYHDLQKRLLVDVDPTKLEGTGGEPCYRPDAQSESAQTCLQTILSYANDELTDVAEDYPVLKGSLIADAIRCCKPDGPLTSPLASCLTRLYYLKKGLSVLAALPLTRGKLRWFDGEFDEPDVACSALDYLETVRYGPDSLSVHQIINAQLMTLLVSDLRKDCASQRHRTATLYHLLEENPQLNHRQRSILARAARMPFAEFHIHYHQEKHRVAYSTARRDLLELAELGYLRKERQGKAFIFVPDKRATTLLGPDETAELSESLESAEPWELAELAESASPQPSAALSLSRQIPNRSQATRPVQCALHFTTPDAPDPSMNSTAASKPARTTKESASFSQTIHFE
ncbi:MAG: hypothetical protein LBH64_00055 [Coriobacteriales bacterium]|jgi:hypothetical protein|nr:hypothetical protein [Coriobacteriales bacterium]